MEVKILNKELRKRAVDNGLCQQWQNEWLCDWDLKKMVAQFYRGIDFFLQKRFISNDFIKENFEKQFLRENGIIVDDKYSLLNPEYAIFLGNSSSTIRYNGRNVSTIYITDNSSVKILAKTRSVTIVHLLGSAFCETEQDDTATIVVIVHSELARIAVSKNTKVRYELDYLKV